MRAYELPLPGKTGQQILQYVLRGWGQNFGHHLQLRACRMRRRQRSDERL